MTVKERILEYLNYKGITIYAFEKSIGKTKSYFRNTANITSDTCALVCEKYPDINTDWLLRGEGNMIRETSEVPENTMEDTGVRKRLLEFIDYLGTNHPTFEAKCNLAHSTISHIKYGISSANLRKIAITYPQLDIYWLIGVSGHQMIRTGFDENGDLRERLDRIVDILSRMTIG